MNFKSEKGSVSLYVLMAMVLLTITLVALHVSASNKQVSQLEVAEQIKAVYEQNVTNVDEVYDDLMNNI